MKSSYESIRSELKSELNPKRMQRLVREFGSFPSGQRSLVWRYILSLPQNSKKFREMIAKLPPSDLPKAWNDWIASNKEINNKSIKTHLKWVLSWLAAWSPEISTVAFLPQFVLPFVRVLHLDPITCFELLTTVLCNWGRFWLEMNPVPPFDLMCLTEKLLEQFGPGAFKILKQNSINVTSYAWSLLEHGFALVLEESQWVQLWDHLLVNRPALMFAAAVAYVSVTENSLRNFAATKGNLEGFYRCTHQLDMRQFLRKAYEILDTVTNWPASLSRPLTCLPEGEYPDLAQLMESEETNQEVAAPAPTLHIDQEPQVVRRQNPMDVLWEGFQV